MGKVKLSSPWVLYYHELYAFFIKDSEVRVVLDEDEVEIKLFVDNPRKADALTQLLPTEKNFGSVKVKVTVISTNNLKKTKFSLIQDALDGNDAVSYFDSVEDVFTNPIGYVVFDKEVVQYFTDDLGDIHGCRSTLYQDMAKEIFGNLDGVCFCTDTL